jgi:hypothetical protein
LDKIEAAAALLAGARTGAALDGLPEALRPASLAEAEAMQNATLAALGETCGGWKLGRQGEVIFAAPIPASHILPDPADGAIPMPAARFIELELAIRFHQPVAPEAMAGLRPEDLPVLAHIGTLFELVQPRFAPSAPITPLDRIAECLANHGAAIRTAATPWTLALLDAPPPVRLSQNEGVIATREGPHVATPIRPLIEAWIARLAREQRGIAAGEVLTFGSLSGMPAIPQEGADYLGEIEGLPPLALTVASV